MERSDSTHLRLLLRCIILTSISQVSMFKKNYDHHPMDVYFGNYKEATRGNPNYFLTYGNGKAAARIQDHLRHNSAHSWHNYMKTPKYG
ncbi:hypothetical protein K1719_012528 [Acacia pycnantha]|nr:hypothetical protein K1719_012528 [Acacia pycnantha]